MKSSRTSKRLSSADAGMFGVFFFFCTRRGQTEVTCEVWVFFFFLKLHDRFAPATCHLTLNMSSAEDYSTKNKQRSSRWSVEEDEQLREAVQKEGYLCWKKIALHFQNRTSKQVRERYVGGLNFGFIPTKN